jgi:hypothetical protein
MHQQLLAAAAAAEPTADTQGAHEEVMAASIFPVLQLHATLLPASSPRCPSCCVSAGAAALTWAQLES